MTEELNLITGIEMPVGFAYNTQGHRLAQAGQRKRPRVNLGGVNISPGRLAGVIRTMPSVVTPTRNLPCGPAACALYPPYAGKAAATLHTTARVMTQRRITHLHSPAMMLTQILKRSQPDRGGNDDPDGDGGPPILDLTSRKS